MTLRAASLLLHARPCARVAHCPHSASHFSRAQSGMNSLLTTYGKGDLLPHELFLSFSFPETWMDFILINDEAWALRAEERGAVSLERRRKRKKCQRLLAIDVQGGLSLSAPPRLEAVPE